MFRDSSSDCTRGIWVADPGGPSKKKLDPIRENTLEPDPTFFQRSDLDLDPDPTIFQRSDLDLDP